MSTSSTSPRPSILSAVLLPLLILLLVCVVSIADSDDDFFDDEPEPIVDDYNEPIPQVAKHDNVNSHEDDDDLERELKSNDDKLMLEYGKPPDSAEETEDADGEPDDEDDDERGRRTNLRRSKAPELAVHDQEPPPLPSTSPRPPSSDTTELAKPPRPEPKLGPDWRSLLVKVYRGPTKQINERPFASWGYFVKYPSDNGKSTSPSAGNATRV